MTDRQQRHCIYCLEKRPEEAFSKPEHVVPAAFGKFRDNFTLLKVVCDDCNQYFGDHLEIELGRDTFEGEARFRYGVKKPSEYKSRGKRSRLIRKWEEGPFKGAYFYLRYSSEFDKVLAHPCPQVGFRKADGEYEYFLLDEISTKESLADRRSFDLDHPEVFRLFALDAETARAVLQRKGFSFKFDRFIEHSADEPTADFLAKIEGTIDKPIFRAIAKIAFNYLAYWEGPDFVLHEDFNRIRRFIRLGEKPDYTALGIQQESVLADEPVEGWRRLGHLITLNWAQDGVSILAQVSLLNWVKYAVCLAPDFSGERKPITRGHFFDLEDGEIYPLMAR